MASNIKNYKNSDIIDEIHRRHKKGSNIIDLFPATVKCILWGGRDYRRGLKPGSKRSLALKYHFSDKELVLEVLRRITDEHSRDCFTKLKLLMRQISPTEEEILRGFAEALDRELEKKSGKI